MVTVLTKAKIDIKNGLIELEGSEAFVSENIKMYSDLLTSYNHVETLNEEQINTHVKESIDHEDEKIVPSTHNNNNNKFISHFGVSEEELNSVIYTENGNFKIITNQIKGRDAEKQTSLSLLYCLANEFYGNRTDTRELRDLCKHYACLDSKNFSAYLRKKQIYFLLDGEKGSKSNIVKLTAPGKEEAKRLIKTLVLGE